ncbi:MAG: hypothetical protein ACI3YC_08975, partial [Alloprevotella sp.]
YQGLVLRVPKLGTRIPKLGTRIPLGGKIIHETIRESFMSIRVQNKVKETKSQRDKESKSWRGIRFIREIRGLKRVGAENHFIRSIRG